MTAAVVSCHCSRLCGRLLLRCMQQQQHMFRKVKVMSITTTFAPHSSKCLRLSHACPTMGVCAECVCLQGAAACALLHPPTGHPHGPAATPCSQGGLPGQTGMSQLRLPFPKARCCAASTYHGVHSLPHGARSCNPTKATEPL